MNATRAPRSTIDTDVYVPVMATLWTLVGMLKCRYIYKYVKLMQTQARLAELERVRATRVTTAQVAESTSGEVPEAEVVGALSIV